MQCFRIIGHMMPFVIMLHHQFAIFMVDLRLTIHHLRSRITIGYKIILEHQMYQVIDMHHTLAIQHTRRTINCSLYQLREISNNLRLLTRHIHDLTSINSHQSWTTNTIGILLQERR